MYTVICDLFPHNCFGVFNSILDARHWLESVLNTEDFVSWEDIGDYTYIGNHVEGDTLTYEIISDEGIIFLE